jgi:flagellar hook protein FlgE
MKAPAKATENVGFFCNLDADGTESTATLTSADTTNVTNVSGQAVNGAGGTHTITVGGANATQGTLTGSGPAMTADTTLGDLGITTFDDFTVAIDGGDPITVSGLEAGTKISQLTTILDNMAGISAEFDSPLAPGQITLTRDLHGSGTGIVLGGAVASTVFGSAIYSDGTASSLVASDSFQPSGGGDPIVTNLQLTEDPITGLKTGITGLGGGGVTIAASASTGGLQAGQLVIETADTSHSTSIVTYDSLGAEHTVTFNFTKTATPNVWNWEATVEEPAVTTSGNTGTISFNENGSLQAFTYNGGASAFTFNPGNGAAPAVTIALDAGEVGAVDGITQFASTTTTIAQNQDGYGMGNLSNVYIDENGTIIGSFTNDQNLTLAQIVLADFHNPQGLLKAGGNMYKVSANSGDAIYGMSQTDFGSSINSGVVEMSNVELSKEFADMIIAQRGFQASARVISTADQLLQEVVQLKR